MRNGSEKLLVRVDARAAELEDYRMRLCSQVANQIVNNDLCVPKTLFELMT